MVRATRCAAVGLSSRTLRVQHLLDTFHYFLVFKQFTAASGSATFLDGLDKPGIVFQHAVDGFLDHLRGWLATTNGDFLKPGLFLR